MDILPAVLEHATAQRPLRESVRLWTLVLEARGVDYRLRDRTAPSEDAALDWSLEVLEPEADRARDEILAFERENRSGRPMVLADPSPWAVPGALAVVLGLICLHGLSTGAGSAWTGLPAEHGQWVHLGAADARRMLMYGEWYRAATALTLHADAEHLGANACLGGVFLVLSARELGLGVALCATILSGVLGNACNAWFHGGFHGGMHLSLGASTAVFGLLGALTMFRTLALHSLEASIRAHERPMMAWIRVFGPLAAGIIMLSFFGTGGQEGASRTDLLAHLFGFLAGVGLGAVVHAGGQRLRRLPWAVALGWGSLLLVAWSWWQALQAA
ncbi:rhomboid family intramembrane serine protease [Megalodesulfovibrio paquesii]